MDLEKELQLIELRAQVSLLYELLQDFEVFESQFAYNKINAILQDKQEQIIELEKQLNN